MAPPDDPLNSLQLELSSLALGVKDDPEARGKLLQICMSTTGVLLTPKEQIYQMINQPNLAAVLDSALRAGIIDLLNSKNEPVSVEVLAKETGFEALLIVRLLRPLAGTGMILETDMHTWTSTPVSQALQDPGLRACWFFMHDEHLTCAHRLHDFILHTKTRNSADASQTNFEFSRKTDLPMFDHLQQNPTSLANFNTMIQAWRVGRAQWFDLYPVVTHLGACLVDKPLLVDIGGSVGHNIQNFHNHFPDLPGRRILQDLPKTIEAIKPDTLDPSIEPMVYDFFTPQPIKGAKAYYLSYICHNWSDEKVKQILLNQVQAMEKGWSKLLIDDWVIPDKEVALMPAMLDISMMTLLSGLERTEKQWRDLMDGVDGLEIVKIWGGGNEIEGLIECVRV